MQLRIRSLRQTFRCAPVLALQLCFTAACRSAEPAPASSAERSGAPSVTPVAEAEAGSTERRQVERVLDDWHAAAARSDADGYFGRMAPGAVFLGTDATERWTVEEFRAYAAPYFAQGNGWRYVPRERHVFVDDDAGVAWADEKLWNEKYGECRGMAVLVRLADAWRIAHYTLSFPVPNDLAPELVRLVRGRG